MIEQKKYTSVTRLGHRSTIGLLNVGDCIIIQEKIDGANASFMREGDKFRAFSRNQELDEDNTLGGFFGFVQTLDVNKLLDGVIYFGEWTNKHKVHYPEHEKQFFMFDIYNTHTSEYVTFSMVVEESNRLGLNCIPVFYIGEYISFEHLSTFIGRTDIGGRIGEEEVGEGIVVKHYKNNSVFVKLVGDLFRETAKQKAPKDPTVTQTQEQLFVNETVTDARIEKLIYKFVDENILDENFGIEDMGLILKNMNQRIYEDILNEESESLPEDSDHKQLRKSIARRIAPRIKKIITDKGGI